MPSILGSQPQYVADHLAGLTAALEQPTSQGGVPAKDTRSLLLATWNLREFGRFTPKWRATSNDTPKRDLRSLLLIATILERFDVIALQELQGYTDALREVLRWLNRERPNRWRVVVSDVVRGDAGDDERLGYLFDSSVYDLDGLVGEIVIPPDEVQLTTARMKGQFAKTPYCASFRSVHDTSVAFVLNTVHVVWGKKTANREAEANRLAQWIEAWVKEPHVWDPDMFALGDFNADRITDPAYKPFADTLTIPPKMHTFPRTIFAGGKDKHYDQIAWYTNQGSFGLNIDDCGYFDIDSVLRPGFDLTAGSFSFRISDHYPLWARFTWP